MIKTCSRAMVALAVFATCGFIVPAADAQDRASVAPRTIVPTDYLALPAVGRYGRLLLHRDAVEAQLATGEWKLPAVGDTVKSVDGRQVSWQRVANEDGALDTSRFRGGWAVATFESPDERVMLLEAQGHAAVYVNGEPRAGDPYRLGWLHLPVQVRKGQNTLLFHVAADRLTVKLSRPSTGVFFANHDRTLPTVVRGDAGDLWAAVPLVNATADWLEYVNIETQAGDERAAVTPVAPLAPLSVRKVPFQLHAPQSEGEDSQHFELRLVRADADESNDGDAPLDVSDIMLDVAGADDIHIRTFRSRIDGSVQPYAVWPATESSESPNDLPGVLVTLHDAGIACDEQAERYSPKTWTHIVAPQGRRPYGFDWESWSRIDALEALTDAGAHYSHDPRRICLTGNGMGGHGAWHIGALFPDKFAAVGASDSWISFWSYGGGMPSIENPTPIEAMLLRGYAPSETVALLHNLANLAVFILHDPNAEDVPVEQARFLRQELAGFHPHFVYHERSADDDADTSHVSSPEMMAFFKNARRPAPQSTRTVDFTTADPAISSSCEFVVIDSQLEQLLPSRIEMSCTESGCEGATSNVARLGIPVAALPRPPAAVTIDNQRLTPLNPAADGVMWFELDGGRWDPAEPPSPEQKNSQRSGTFTAAFDHNVLLVYGTKGDEDENRWAEAKARFDAETFYYRGGGALEVSPDVRFDPQNNRERSVILYGNSETNAAWKTVLADCPVEVRRGEVRVGDRVETGDDLAVLMVRPRSGSDTALVGVVAGTGPTGLRLTNRLRWFVSGIVYPDLLIAGPGVLTNGERDVRACGYFGRDWSIDDAEIAWREATP